METTETVAYSTYAVSSLPDESGIYAIVRIDNGDRYVGQAKNIRTRVATHLRDVVFGRERTSADMLLQKAWDEFGRAAFIIRVLELVTDNEHSIVASVRNSNLSLAKHYYINQGAAYNKDKKIVRKDQLGLVESFAWRFPIDDAILARIAAAPRSVYKVGTRVDFEYAVLVMAHNEVEAKKTARSVSVHLKGLTNLSSSRLTMTELREAIDAGVPDRRVVAEPFCEPVDVETAGMQ